MPRRTSSFARALKDAEKRLVNAKTQRLKIQKEIALLDSEIPALERTIIALNNQLKPAQFVHLSEIGSIDLTSQPPGQVGMPMDLAKLAGPQDLTGMGSKYLTEEDLLPTPEGEPLVPEE